LRAMDLAEDRRARDGGRTPESVNGIRQLV
jgi:hypothetical protein